jgi:hypothetical protein
MYFSHSSSDQSGSMASRFLTVEAACVATISPPSVKARPLIFAAVLGPAALVDGADQLDEDLLALAAHDDVDPGRLGKHLLEHEGRMHAAEDADRVRHGLLRDLQHPLGLVDRRRDRGDADHVRLQRAHPLGERLVLEMVGHRVDEGDAGVARRLQRARRGRRPRRAASCRRSRHRPNGSWGGSASRASARPPVPPKLAPPPSGEIDMCQLCWTRPSRPAAPSGLSVRRLRRSGRGGSPRARCRRAR